MSNSISNQATSNDITILTSVGRQVVWAVFNGDGHECSDLLGVFGTEGEAQAAAVRVEKLIRAYHDKHLRGEWYGYVEVKQLTVNEYELPADAQMTLEETEAR